MIIALTIYLTIGLCNNLLMQYRLRKLLGPPSATASPKHIMITLLLWPWFAYIFWSKFK